MVRELQASRRASTGETTGTVSIVLATAISSSAVQASGVMSCVSSRMLAKRIMISWAGEARRREGRARQVDAQFGTADVGARRLTPP